MNNWLNEPTIEHADRQTHPIYLCHWCKGTTTRSDVTSATRCGCHTVIDGDPEPERWQRIGSVTK
jgi:hypothetical protein